VIHFDNLRSAFASTFSKPGSVRLPSFDILRGRLLQVMSPHLRAHKIFLPKLQHRPVMVGLCGAATVSCFAHGVDHHIEQLPRT